MISRPKDLYEIFLRQSVDSRDYDTYLNQREKYARSLEKIETGEVETEIAYRQGDMNEDMYNKVMKLY